MDVQKLQFRRRLFLVAAVVFAIIAFLFWFLRGASSVSVVVYGSSTDPQTIQVERSLFELNEVLEGRIDLDIKMVSSLDGRNDFQSLSAGVTTPSEAAFDIAENQIQHVVRDLSFDGYVEYLQIRNVNIADMNSDTYVKEAGIDFDAVRAGLQSDVGKNALVAASEEYADLAEENDIVGLPAIFIDGEYFDGGFSKTSLAAEIVKPLLRGNRGYLGDAWSLTIFGGEVAFEAPWDAKQINGLNECYQDLDCNDKTDKEGSCKNIGERDAFCVYEDPADVSGVVISDETCVSCFSEKAVAALRKDFKGLEVREVDLDSEEARDLISLYQINGIPAFIFDKNVEDGKNFSFYLENELLAPLTEDSSAYLHTQTEARKLVDRPLVENKLDLFVIPTDPLSDELQKALIDLQQEKTAAGEESFDLDFHPVLSIDVNDQGINEQISASPGGEEATRESIRMAVIAQFFPDAERAYVIDRIANPERPYEELLQELGVSVQSFNNIVDQQGEATVLEAAALSAELTVQSVPYFFWENQVIVLRIEDLKKIDMFTDLNVSDE